MSKSYVPAVSVSVAQTGRSSRPNEMGMRAMQERAYERRGEQYLLIKAPPASGKSRALMFIALDKLHHQGVDKAIIAVPEKAIGSSFNNEPLSQHGFFADWRVEPRWNLCDAPGGDGGSKVKALGSFLKSGDRTLVCTHATFRFAVDELGIEAFDDCVIAIDEFHHVSANPDNKLGSQLTQIIQRERAHIVAMTGSYFRGDTAAVLSPEDEAKFQTVTYTYYEQLNGYEYLKNLDIGYYFYSGAYTDDIMRVLNPDEKTIIHIPNVNSKESTKEKIKEVEGIIDALGEWVGHDEKTGFQLVRRPDGRVLKIADLVDDADAAHRGKVLSSLKDPLHKFDRDHVDIIIALGMAKEGFDWIWCEHALTVGYRASLTEIVQIIGRATRDAPGKARARFTNLIAEPDAAEELVIDAVNDTLKAIAASLLMEQVLAPKFEFTPKRPGGGPVEGIDYGPEGYDPNRCNVGVNRESGAVHVEIKGLKEPESEDAKRIIREDIAEIIAPLLQDKTALERGLFDEETIPQQITQERLGKIIRDRSPHLSPDDIEAVRQVAVAALNLTQRANVEIKKDKEGGVERNADGEPAPNLSFLNGVKKFAMDVRDLDIDMIDRINPFAEAYSILAKTMSEASLRTVAAIISAKRISITPEEARELASIAVKSFKKDRGRLPELTASDPWERRLAEGARAFMQYKANGAYDR